jgi:hypothetical protein
MAARHGMSKTTFSSGVIVTSEFLNGFQQIYFDGQDLDHHYPPLGLNSLVRTGPNGLDAAYVSLTGNQPELDSAGKLLAGIPISGAKVVTGFWSFGYDPLQVGNPTNVLEHAPKSFTTNDKFSYANGVPATTAAKKFAALASEDIVTKEVVEQWVEFLFDTRNVDNGIYYSATTPTCDNYGVGGTSEVICPA